MKKFWIILILIVAILLSIIILYNKDSSSNLELNQGEDQEFGNVIEDDKQESNETTEIEGPNLNSAVQSDGSQENIKEENDILNEAGYILSDSQGAVSIAIAFENLLIEQDSENLVFSIMLNTHSVNLDEIDIASLATLENDQGLKIKDGFVWEIRSGGGHHLDGSLKISKIYNGTNIIDKSTNSITLKITGLDGNETSEFTWNKEQLDQLAK